MRARAAERRRSPIGSVRKRSRRNIFYFISVDFILADIEIFWNQNLMFFWQKNGGMRLAMMNFDKMEVDQ